LGIAPPAESEQWNSHFGEEPGTTAEVTFEETKLIAVGDTNDAMKLAAGMTTAAELSQVLGENAIPAECCA
jgi:hypothetical protein